MNAARPPLYALLQCSLFGDPEPVNYRAKRFLKLLQEREDREVAFLFGLSHWKVARIRWHYGILRRHYYRTTEERMIRDLGPTLSDRELGLTLDRTEGAMCKKRQRMDVEKRRSYRFAA